MKVARLIFYGVIVKNNPTLNYHMSRLNAMGGGLQTEMSAVRIRMAHAEKRAKAAAPAPAAPPPPQPMRRVVVFNPKMPAVSKNVSKPPPMPKGAKTRLVVKVKVKSPALQRRLGVA